MTTTIVPKVHLIGTGYAEMPQDGRRYRFHIERYRDDAGEEWGQIVSMEEIPDVGPYLWIPSWGADASETQYLVEEHEHEKTHPDPVMTEWWAEHRAAQKKKLAFYDEARDYRVEIIRRNPVTHGRG